MASGSALAPGAIFVHAYGPAKKVPPVQGFYSGAGFVTFHIDGSKALTLAGEQVFG